MHGQNLRIKNMKILVTGGAGFLGSHICDLLIKKGHSVICVDNLITGNTDNIKHLGGNRKFRFLKHDVTEYISIKGNLHAILHFASPSSPIDYLQLPIQTLKVGSLGTHKMLGLAKKKGAKFLLASSSEVYGDPLVHPQKEDYWGNVNPVGPRGVYDESKRFGEALAVAYGKVHGVDIRIARIFNTFGPRMRKNDGRVVPAFITQALTEKPLTVFGDGKQTRSFCYVEDLVRGIYKLLLSRVQCPVNLGNPTEMTVNEFARQIISLTNSKSRLVNKPLPVDDPKVRQPDIARAKKFLKWEPRVPVKEGLKLTIAWFKEELDL